MKKNSDKRRSFWALKPGEKAIVLRAIVMLVGSKVALGTIGFARTQKLFGPSRKRSTLTQLSAQQIAGLCTATARRLFVKTNCLEQSLVIWSLLKRRGFPAELRFGARKEAEKFEAHAWVELHGAILNDDGEVHRHFVPFESAGARSD